MERYAEAKFQCCKMFRYCKTCAIDVYFKPNFDTLCAFCRVQPKKIVYMTEFSTMMTQESQRNEENYFVFDLNDTGLLRRRKRAGDNESLLNQVRNANQAEVQDILMKNIRSTILPLFPGGIAKRLIPPVYQHIWDLKINDRDNPLLTSAMLL